MKLPNERRKSMAGERRRVGLPLLGMAAAAAAAAVPVRLQA